MLGALDTLNTYTEIIVSLSFDAPAPLVEPPANTTTPSLLAASTFTLVKTPLPQELTTEAEISIDIISTVEKECGDSPSGVSESGIVDVAFGVVEHLVDKLVAVVPANCLPIENVDKYDVTNDDATNDATNDDATDDATNDDATDDVTNPVKGINDQERRHRGVSDVIEELVTS